jgi:DNA-directed RNA polymerase specialized sigma24 family protein
MPNPEHARWFAEEILPHEPRLRAWLRGRFPTRTDIDDLVQETYARLFRARSAGEVRNARNYLYAVARNAEETAVPEAVGQRQELEMLRAAMAALPQRCRQVFTLRKLYGLSHREIAAQLAISERTVEAQIDKAMRRCAAYLRERGLP